MRFFWLKSIEKKPKKNKTKNKKNKNKNKNKNNKNQKKVKKEKRKGKMRVWLLALAFLAALVSIAHAIPAETLSLISASDAAAVKREEAEESEEAAREERGQPEDEKSSGEGETADEGADAGTEGGGSDGEASSSSKAAAASSSSSSSTSSTSSSSSSAPAIAEAGDATTTAAAAAAGAGEPDADMPPPVSVTPDCEVCRKLVQAHATRDPGHPERLYKPCRSVSVEMRPGCDSWLTEDRGEALIEPEIEPGKVCIALGFCDARMAAYLQGLDEAFAARAGSESVIQSGSVVLAKGDDIMREMYEGSGPRRVDTRVAFAVPFEAIPRVHVGLSRILSPGGRDLRIRVMVTSVDRFGFDVDVLTWLESKLETIGLEWTAYSDAFVARGEIRNGIIALPKPTTSERRIYFPGTFAIEPHVVVAITGMDAPNNRDAHFRVEATRVTREGFTLNVVSPAEGEVRMANLRWLAFQNTTRMFSGSLRLNAREDKDFANFYNPPLGDRSIERSIIFGPTLEGACADPASKTELEAVEMVDVLLQQKSKVRSRSLSRSRSLEAPPPRDVTPAIVPWNAAVKVFVKQATPGMRVAFVLTSDPGCFEAFHRSLVADGLRQVTLDPSAYTTGLFRVCLAPATAAADKDFSVLGGAGATLTVAKSAVTAMDSVFKPSPPGVDSPWIVTGNGVQQGDRVALLPDSTVGCTGAKARAGIVTPHMRLAVPPSPTGDYKVCYANAQGSAKADPADDQFYEQWSGGQQLNYRIGDGADKPPQQPEASFRATVLNDGPTAFWTLAERPGAKDAQDISRTKLAPAPAGPGVKFLERGLARDSKGSASFDGGAEARITSAKAEGPRGGKFTVEAWVRPASLDKPLQGLVQRSTKAGGGYALYLRKDRLVCETSAGADAPGGPKTSEAETRALKTGRTYHVACTLTGSVLRVYINGIEGASAAEVAEPGAGAGASTVLGAYRDDAEEAEPNALEGALEGVALYAGVALSPLRLYKRYQQGYLDDGSMSKCSAVEDVPPIFANRPSVRTLISGFNFAKDSSISVSVDSLRASAEGFTMDVSTEGDSRLQDLVVTWIANDQPAVPPRFRVAARDSAAGAVDKEDSETGASALNPGKSCLDIMNRKGASRGDGVYFLRAISGKVFRAYCDMTNGGWTRVVNISPTSSFHGGDTAESNILDLAKELRPAKLDDTDINMINTVNYFWYKCGAAYSAYVRNANNLWTSALTNDQDWSISRKRDPNEFLCKASQKGAVFSDREDPECKKGYTEYSSRDGKGCYVDGVGWGQAGSLWAK